MFVERDSIKVLVVEDEESYRQALSSGLGREGFDVVLASDGPEGLRLFDEQHPDIVLLDMLLPGMHGIDVCRTLRSVSDVPILMVSAVDTELDVVLGLELGASGYVTKPFRLRELVARMHAILRRVQPRDTRPQAAPPTAALGDAGRAHWTPSAPWRSTTCAGRWRSAAARSTCRARSSTSWPPSSTPPSGCVHATS